jgi:hypothetical protein
MATSTEVKEYLAKWLQMGKKVLVNDTELTLTQVINGENYSPEFEQLWHQLIQSSTGSAGSITNAIAYLEGANETIQDLLKPEWEILSCAVCDLPVPTLSLGFREIKACPCDDLKMHPNLETIAPRSPVKTSSYLQKISDRLA